MKNLRTKIRTIWESEKKTQAFEICFCLGGVCKYC